MSDYTATVLWQRQGAVFLDQRYSRAHRWSFDGGLEIPASSSPQVVPLPMSDAHRCPGREARVPVATS